MRLIVLFLILIAAGALAVGAFVYIDAGYVMLSWENYTVETSLWMFLVLGAIALLAVYIALRALLVLFGSDRRFNEWRQRRRSLRARRQTTRGLLALAQGQWRRAERNLT
ncbi:MAG: heme biosynthesis HemY N-terminal domain-containing protein, partial [Pseudomonadota bacterium]|nr:heme biosynthesis HemY N-terminal domain-containing protein [Pseudomonadota bacterium]